MFHTNTDPSADPAANRWQVGLNATRDQSQPTLKLSLLQTINPVSAIPISTPLPQSALPERPHDLVLAQVQQVDGVVPHAAQQKLAVLGQVERGDLALHRDVVAGAVRRPGVPEADLLVKVPADDGRAVRRDEVVAARAGELGFCACFGKLEFC